MTLESVCTGRGHSHTHTHTHTQWNLMRLFWFSFVGTWELTFFVFSFDAGRDRRAITISAEKDRWIGIRK